MSIKYDLDLFLKLNEEYRDKPVVATPRSLDISDMQSYGQRRAHMLAKKFNLKGKRVLEIGCGRGEVSKCLVKEYGCEVVAVDVRKRDEWQDHEGVTFYHRDLATDPIPDLKPFDFIFSFSVWEHVRHPYSLLKESHRLLKRKGKMYMMANLYRGAQASHRYREVFFPWSHLLFEDEIFEKFYVSQGMAPNRPAWVNHLSIADYFKYFDLIGFKSINTDFAFFPLDKKAIRKI